VEMNPQIRLVPPVGGMILFSGAQLHSSVPNTSGVTRYSIDFRTVHLGDAAARRGAKNVDAACTGTTMRDYLRISDLSHLPDEVIRLHDDGTADKGKVLYRPADVVMVAASGEPYGASSTKTQSPNPEPLSPGAEKT